MTTPENNQAADAQERRSAEAVESQLVKILDDTEAALQDLRKELSLQREYRAQHEAVERLPEYLTVTSSRWENVRTFFEELIKELRAGREHSETAADDEKREDSPRG